MAPDRIADMQKLSRTELEALQWARLRQTLERVMARSPFYQKLYRERHVKLDKITSRQALREMAPMIDKKMLLADQEAAPPFGTRLLTPEQEIMYTCMTSGATGLGQEVHPFSFADMAVLAESWGTMFRWRGLVPGDRIYLFWPVAVQIAGLSMAYAMQEFKASCFFGATLDTERKLRTMKRFPPQGIITVPAYLTRLTVLCQEMGIEPRRDFPTLKMIDASTQAFSSGWVREMQEFWGVPLAELYGSSQSAPGVMFSGRGDVLREDGSRGLLCAMEQTLYFEVLDRGTGEPVRSGEEGDLVITNFRQTTPLIRFRMEDRVTYYDHTHCRQGYPFAGLQCGTIARYDDMMKIKGQNVWPEAIDEVVFSFPPVSEYNGRVYIDAKGREVAAISFEMKRTARLNEEDLEALTERMGEKLRSHLGVSFHLQVAPHGTVERFTFKARRWTDERRTGRQVEKYLAT